MSRSTKRSAPGQPETASQEPFAADSDAPLLDRLATDVVLRHVPGGRVLDVGTGVRLVSHVVPPRAGDYETCSPPAPGDPLPYPDASFDVTLCLRTLPFLDRDSTRSEAHAAAIVGEMARVTSPGGALLFDVDNPQSLRGAFFGVRNPMKVVEAGPLVVETADGPNRFDTLGRFLRLLPDDLQLVDLHGLQVLAALPELHATPILGRLLTRAEWWARDLGFARRFGAHLLLVMRKLSAPSIPQ